MWRGFLVFTAVLLFTGCSGGNGAVNVEGGADNAGQTRPDTPTAPAEALDRYALANGCFALQSMATNGFVVRGKDGAYTTDATDAQQASGFYMKPSALGQYLLYADNQTLLADEKGALSAVAAPADKTGWKVNEGVIWVVDGGGDSYFTVRSVADNGQALAVDDDGKLVVSSTGMAQHFLFVPVDDSRCAAFPEISTDTEGETYTQEQTYDGAGTGKPVVGVADVHMHMSATGFLGGAHAGRPFSPYGVTVALPDAVKVHGPDNHFDLIGNLYGGKPLAAADTQGWPTFKDWPAWDMLTFESTYYKWVERRWKSGLRLMVNNLVQNDALCQLESVAKSANPADLQDLLTNVGGAVTGLISDGCDGMTTAFRQLDFMHRLEDYIDAQAGGPGKGWFRIVTSPEQAREVISQGKLAVVLGIEISNVFGCHVIIPTLAGQSSDVPLCNQQQIDQQLDRLYKAGVRQINLVHEFNNALGGNGIFNGAIINVGNFWDTGSFWQTHACPTSDPSGHYKDYYYTPGAIMTSVDPLANIPENPLSPVLGTVSGLLNGLLQGTLPAYPTKVRQCNVRDITPLGRYAVQEVMKKGMMVDVDHMSVKMKGEVIDIASQQQPAYPVISSHGGHGGITLDQARQILDDGGIIYPIDCSAASYVNWLDKLQGILPPGRPLAMGCSSDINGMAAQPAPVKTDTPVTYPFTLFQGPGWSDPMFTGIKPVTFEESCIPEGKRCFNFNTEGIAQYGLYADWVEAVRIAGGQKAIDALYRSAEAYLDAWQKARNRS